MQITKIFTGDTAFAAYYAAAEWCEENGISHGSMCCDEPIGLLYGEHHIQKWRNIRTKDRETFDGLMTSEDFRNGPVQITITEKPNWTKVETSV